MTATPVRASDVDRQLIVEVLQEQTAAGRLSLDEFSERAAGAYSATTRLELDDLVADLPAAPVRVPGGGSDAAVAEPVVPILAGEAAAIWIVVAPPVCLLTVLIVIGLLAGSPATLLVTALVGFAVWRSSPGGSAAVGRQLRPWSQWRPAGDQGRRPSLWAFASGRQGGGGMADDDRHD